MIEKDKEVMVVMVNRTNTKGKLVDFDDKYIKLQRQVDLDGSGKIHLIPLAQVSTIEWEYSKEEKK